MRCCYVGGLLLYALLAVLSNGHAFQDKKPPKKPQPVFLDPAKAGIEFALQGEYVGKVGDKSFGAQVIALGDGTFEVNFLPGGLPGDGWDGKTRVKVKATLNKMPDGAADQAKLEGGKWVGTLATTGKPVLRGKSDQGDEFLLTRTLRKSKTEGLAPPAGAVILFDGKHANEWGGGKVVEGNLLQMGTNSKLKFKNFKLHIEFRTPFQPTARGQGRGNSGVYLQGRYEIQILDSFGLKGLNNECGGIYGHTAPLVNMCYPPLSWQTYDIDYQAARFDAQGKETAAPRVTVLHNGVLIHDNVEIKGKHSNQLGPIHLQNHGNPVYFRNIWIMPEKDA